MLRRRIGDCFRAVANKLDPPRPIVIAPIRIQLGSRAIADHIRQRLDDEQQP